MMFLLFPCSVHCPENGNIQIIVHFLCFSMAKNTFNYFLILFWSSFYSPDLFKKMPKNHWSSHFYDCALCFCSLVTFDLKVHVRQWSRLVHLQLQWPGDCSRYNAIWHLGRFCRQYHYCVRSKAEYWSCIRQ